MASYGGELLLDSSSPWSGISSLSSFSISLSFIFQEAKESIDEEDPRPTSSNGAYIIYPLNLRFYCIFNLALSQSASEYYGRGQLTTAHSFTIKSNYGHGQMTTTQAVIINDDNGRDILTTTMIKLFYKKNLKKWEVL